MKIDLLWNGKTVDSALYKKTGYSGIVSNVKVDFAKWPVVSNQVRCHLMYDGKKFIKLDPPYQSVSKPIRVALIVESPHKDEFSYDFTPLQPLNGESGKKFESKIINKISGWFLQALTTNTIVEIKIFNPVKYQTSLYHFLSNLIAYDRLDKQTPTSFTIPEYGSIRDVENSSLRNEVWRILFTNTAFPCETDFVNEIKLYNPQYIVNACTGSNNPNLKMWSNANQIYKRTPKKPISSYSADNLKTIVRRSVFTYFNTPTSSILYMEDIHPCQW